VYFYRLRAGDLVQRGQARAEILGLDVQITFRKESREMDTKRFVVGTIVGAVVLYLVGYVIFDWAFAAFYAANAGSATGVNRGEIVFWALVLANLSYAALIMYAIGNRAGSPSIFEGAKIGAIVGFLLWFTADFYFYGASNIANLTRTVVDPLLEIVHAGIAGAVIALVLKKIPASGSKAA
jgi:hypothetical protein